MTIKLWSAADIGRALDGRRGSLVMLWYRRGKLPEPWAKTQDGLHLWSHGQAQEIIAERWAHLKELDRKYEERLRQERLVREMVARQPIR